MATATQPPPPLSDVRRRDDSSVSLRVRYLQVYNLLSCMAWITVLGRVLLLVLLVGFEHVHGGVGTWLRWTQTMAGLEVFHSLSGAFSLPPSTSLLYFRSICWLWGLMTSAVEGLGLNEFGVGRDEYGGC